MGRCRENAVARLSVIVSLVILTLAISAAEWPALVAGYVPPEPGEHPRLFFRVGDLPEMRRRAATPEGKAIVERLRRLLDGARGLAMPHVTPPTAAHDDDGDEPAAAPGAGQAYTLWHGAGYGMLWQLTGDRRYADLGR